MRATARSIVLGLFLVLPGLPGCGQERAERGAVTAPEVASPESKREMGETEAQREAETDRGVSQQEQKALDEAARERKKE